MSYRITLERDTLRFSAAHFATFEGECEPLHGQNYQLVVKIDGALTPDSWVFDFSKAKIIIAGICKELDHKFLLQMKSHALQISEQGSEYVIAFHGRRYVMPKADVAALPLDNSTAERLAEWCGGRIATELGRSGARRLESITVGVEEAPGQTGWCTLRLDSAARPDEH